MNKFSSRFELQTDASGVQCWVYDITAQKVAYELPTYPTLKSIAQGIQDNGADYHLLPESGVDAFCLIVVDGGAVYLAHGDSVHIDELELVTGGLLAHEPANPCHMVCEGVADPVGEAIEEDAALRFKMGRNADGGVTLSRQPAMTKVQQVGMHAATAMADEVTRQVGKDSVGITIELAGADAALYYHVYAMGGSGETLRLLCSSTSLERLAQFAALIVKR